MRAIVRPPSRAYADCIREDASTRIDVDRALLQHDGYVAALRTCGLDVTVLQAEPAMPDACFVEDTCVIVDGRAIITRPGAPARRAETASVERALPGAVRMDRGSLDGGDIIVTPRAIFAGRSNRTDAEGVAELARIAGRDVRAVDVAGLLHLKTGATWLGGDLIVARRGFSFPGFETLPVHEPHGSTVFAVGRHAVVSAAAPRTADLLARRGFEVHAVDLSEFHLGDAGVTCLSVIL